MDKTIRYLNTDLDLTGADDLTELAEAICAGGAYALHVTKEDDESWRATLETEVEHEEPESNIARFLEIIESLSEDSRERWRRCSLREFNIGYDCGEKP